MNLGDEDARHPSQWLSFTRPSQPPAARRLQKSRKHLGMQRHDLLVAMRVINSIEREVLQAEWENWLIEENVKCKHMGAVLRHNDTKLLAGKSKNGQNPLDVDAGRLEDIRAWQQQYCETCYQELKNV